MVRFYVDWGVCDQWRGIDWGRWVVMEGMMKKRGICNARARGADKRTCVNASTSPWMKAPLHNSFTPYVCAKLWCWKPAVDLLAYQIHSKNVYAPVCVSGRCSRSRQIWKGFLILFYQLNIEILSWTWNLVFHSRSTSKTSTLMHPYYAFCPILAIIRNRPWNSMRVHTFAVFDLAAKAAYTHHHLDSAHTWPRRTYPKRKWFLNQILKYIFRIGINVFFVRYS